MRSRSLAASFRYAWLGLVYALTTQRNMRIHFLIAILVLIAAWILRLPPAEVGVLMLAVSGVIVAETLNTAIETVMDLVSPGYHPLAGTAKNLAAAAVVISAVFAVLTGLVIMGGPLLSWAITTGRILFGRT